MGRLPDTLTETERLKLLNQPNLKVITGLRDCAMIRLMVNCGLRSCEVLSLCVNDIDWGSGKIHIRQSKRNRDRVVWANAEDMDILQLWRSRKPFSDYLFTTKAGGRINDRYLRSMVKRRAVKAGIKKDVYPHLLRHTFATDLLKATKNIRLVQRALGHAYISTTMIYTHVYDEELAGAMTVFRTLHNE